MSSRNSLLVLLFLLLYSKAISYVNFCVLIEWGADYPGPLLNSWEDLDAYITSMTPRYCNY